MSVDVRQIIEAYTHDSVSVEQFVDNMIRVGEALKSHHSYLHRVDFQEAKSTSIFLGCGTVACHAGWILHIFAPERRGRFYRSGIEKLDQELGLVGPRKISFSLFEELMIRLQLWGSNLSPVGMFKATGYSCFGFTYVTRNQCTLKVIGNHYIEVANRIKEFL